MKITRIENQKKRPGRKSLFADGVFLIGVAADTLLRFGLRTRDEIDQRTLKNLESAEELLAARTAALRYLAVRPRTEREIRDQLRAKEFSDQVAAETIASLKESRLLDDAAFARSYIRNAIALKPSGRILLKRKLLLLGIDKSLAEEALGEILEGVNQEEEARVAAQAFVARRTSRGTPGPSLRRQVTTYLLRRGYAWDVVARAVKESLKEVSTEDRREGEDF
jgi:regulatory protein